MYIENIIYKKEQEIYFQMNLPKSMVDRNYAIGMNLNLLLKYVYYKPFRQQIYIENIMYEKSS